MTSTPRDRAHRFLYDGFGLDWVDASLIADEMNEDGFLADPEETARLRATLDKVRRLHHTHVMDRDVCDHCEYAWPCPTIRTLDGDTNE